MLRRVLKTTAATTIRAFGADRLLARWNGRAEQPLVICYHRVVDSLDRERVSAPAMLVSTRTMERQLDWIGRRFRFVGLEELGRRMESGVPFARPVAAVTFDDGYAGVYQHAFPLLRRKGIPFGIFVVTDLVNSRRLQIHDEAYIALSRTLEALAPAGFAEALAALGIDGDTVLHCSAAERPRRLVELAEQLLGTLPRDTMRDVVQRLRERVSMPAEFGGELRSATWRMLAEMRAAGVVVGSHTQRHFVLPNESVDDIRTELAESKRTIEKHLGGAATHVAYPDGQFCPATLQAAREAGYRYGYTTCHHRSAEEPMLTIPRIIFWERSGAGLAGPFSGSIAACEVAGVFDRLRPSRCNHAARRRGAASGARAAEATP